MQDELSQSITREQGKTLPDAEGEMLRGIQVVEHCCSITSLQLGETLGGLTTDMDTYSYREPLGVCAGVAPFNFPAVVPLWVSGWRGGRSECVLAWHHSTSRLWFLSG